MARECPGCRGDLRLHSRFGTVVALQCRGCGELWQQLIPRWLADLLAA